MTMPAKLLSPESEAAACRKAFKGIEIGAIVQHCHHEQWLERLDETYENRISYILSKKPESEQAARLRLFRPLSPSNYRNLPAKLRKADADLQKAYADWQKADADLQKAYADWQKADADWQEADADWQKAGAAHRKICECPWGKETDIFGQPR